MRRKREVTRGSEEIGIAENGIEIVSGKRVTSFMRRGKESLGRIEKAKRRGREGKA